MDPSTAPADEPTWTTEAVVLPEWIDPNDHMNLAYYVLVFAAATEALRRRLGLPEPLRVTQMHTVYEREVTLGDRLVVTSRVLAADERRIHLFHEMVRGGEGYRAAILEIVAEAATAFSAETAARIAALVVASPPAEAGRRIRTPAAAGDVRP